MPVQFLLFLLALSVKDPLTPLRAGCSPDSTLIANLPAGANLKLRYAMSGEATLCYKVSAELDGQSVDGYLPAAAIEGVEAFDQQRKSAAWVETATASAAAPASKMAGKAGAADEGIRVPLTRPILDAERSIDDGRPEEALRQLEPELRAHPDAGLYTIAGVAAWKNQDNRQALEYWRKALDLQPSASLEQLYARVERESKNDKSKETLYGMRVLLRYDDVTVPAETARQMVASVDDTYARVSAELGCTTKERILTIVQSREAYFKTTGAAEWSGGLFDGRIHMPASAGQQMDAQMQKALAHETAHACLAMLGQWPSWLHEGMAQKLSGETLRPEAQAALKQLAKAGKLPKLSDLNQGWMGLDTKNAAIAYALALDAIELLYQNYHSDGVRSLMRSPERLAAISADLDKRLAE